MAFGRENNSACVRNVGFTTVLSIFEWIFARRFNLFTMQQQYKSHYIWKRYQESGMVSYELSKQRPFKDL
jgi:hypothetical protein